MSTNQSNFDFGVRNCSRSRRRVVAASCGACTGVLNHNRTLLPTLPNGVLCKGGTLLAADAGKCTPACSHAQTVGRGGQGLRHSVLRVELHLRCCRAAMRPAG